MLKYVTGFAFALLLSACAGGAPQKPADQSAGVFTLRDIVAYSQKDPRWAGERMGGSGASLKAEGCLVTASAMALTNLGYKINPGDFNRALKNNGGYNARGQLVWASIERITAGRLKATFYNEVNAGIIDGCLARGDYPLARFILPSGRTHWSMIVRRSSYGYHMRDPLHISSQPLIFPAGVSGFKAVRCVGRA